MGHIPIPKHLSRQVGFDPPAALFFPGMREVQRAGKHRLLSWYRFLQQAVEDERQAAAMDAVIVRLRELLRPKKKRRLF